MSYVSITRLRIRSLRFLPSFAFYTMKAASQTRRASGFVTGSLLSDRVLTFWTMTLWREQADMRRYMTNGAHLKAMPKLLHWCDEASIVHWDQESSILPNWEEADRRMRTDGRPSKVNHPSINHQHLGYRTPRSTGATRIEPV